MYVYLPYFTYKCCYLLLLLLRSTPALAIPKCCIYLKKHKILQIKQQFHQHHPAAALFSLFIRASSTLHPTSLAHSAFWPFAARTRSLGWMPPPQYFWLRLVCREINTHMQPPPNDKTRIVDKSTTATKSSDFISHSHESCGFGLHTIENTHKKIYDMIYARLLSLRGGCVAISNRICYW